MIKRITVQDFMAHKETSLDLAEGVTVITGPNNAGKSALVEAIRSVAQNPPIRHAIRHGAAKAIVSVELDTGEIIQWARTEKNAVYQVTRSPGEEPETYAKFGRTVPRSIAALLRMDLVETESGSVDIHIGNQRYPIFLLDQAGSQAAGFFAASTEAEYLLRMQQLLKKRVDRAKTTRRELLDRNERLGKDLEIYSPLGLLGELLERVEGMQSEISRREKLFPVMEEILQRLSHLLGELGYTLDSLNVLERAQSPPDLPDVSLLFLLIKDRASCELRLQTLDRQCRAVSDLTDVPGPQPVQELERLLRIALEQGFALDHAVGHDVVLRELRPPPSLHETAELHDWARTVHARGADWYFERERSSVLHELKGPGTVWDTAVLEAVVSTVTDFQEAHARALDLDSLFASLSAPPAVTGPDDLAALVSFLEKQMAGLDVTGAHLRSLIRLQDPVTINNPADLEVMAQDMAGLMKLLSEKAVAEEDIAVALAAGRAELQQVADEMKSCPLCGQVLDVEHLLRGGHD